MVSVSRTMGASGALRRKPSIASRRESGNLRSGHAGLACRQLIEALGSIPDRLAGLLWLLPNSASAFQPGCVDSPEATIVPVAAVAERAQPLQGTATTWRAQVRRGGCRRLTDRVLADVRTPGGPTGTAKRVFRLDRPSPCGCVPAQRLTRSNRRGTDPYARWCGRGGAARLPPIPINPQAQRGRNR